MGSTKIGKAAGRQKCVRKGGVRVQDSGIPYAVGRAGGPGSSTVSIVIPNPLHRVTDLNTKEGGSKAQVTVGADPDGEGCRIRGSGDQ